MICEKCNTENPNRNYYCKYCGEPLKKGREGKVKKLNVRYDYLLDLSIVEDNTNDKDYYEAYRSKQKVKKEEKFEVKSELTEILDVKGKEQVKKKSKSKSKKVK